MEVFSIKFSWKRRYPYINVKTTAKNYCMIFVATSSITLIPDFKSKIMSPWQ